jgi:methyl-accepting chemotaxis protein
MNYFNKLGIRQKFQLILGISFFTVSLFLFFYFPLKQKSELNTSLQEKARVIAQMVAKSSAAGLVFDEASSVTTLLEAFKQMRDVEFAIVLKQDGKKFAVYNENKYGQYSSKISELVSANINTYSDDEIALELYSILSNNEKQGTVVVGMNKADVNASVSSGRITAFIMSLIIFFSGLGVMRYFFNRIIFNPINKLTLIADKLSSGDVEIKIESSSNDEIGKLEKSFKSIVDSIQEQSNIAEDVSHGELNKTAKVKSDKDVLSMSMNKVIETLRDLINEVKSLTNSAFEGRLSERGNLVKYNGGYREIVEGINETLDAVIIPIREGASALEKIATGDLTVRITSTYKGDHQIIKNSINTVAQSLVDTITQVTESVQATASASNEISSSSEEMAAGAQEQSSQTSEVAGAVEEMTKTILESTKNSSMAAEAAKNAGAIAKEGGKVVVETIEGMNRIAEVVSKSAATVQELGKSSDQIGEIVQVIDDIADQTNLLALNAAIEAARAGEQGRGFAVVADEVRKLAERTTKATKEIAMMIKQIQKDTSGAVASMEEGTKEVEKGKHLADKAGESLKLIIQGAEQVVDVITQVAAASEEQSSASERISKNVESISNVTHESAAGIQQIARASEDLNILTVNLQNLVSKFKLEETRIISGNFIERKLDYKSSLAIRSNGTIVKS